MARKATLVPLTLLALLLQVTCSLAAPMSSTEGQPGNQAALDRIQALREEHRAQRADARDEHAAQKGAEESQQVLTAGRMLKGLGFCVGVLLIGLGVVKRFKRTPVRRRGERLLIIERIPLTPKSYLALVRVKGREILVGVGAEHIAFSEITPGLAGDVEAEVISLQTLAQIESPDRSTANGA